MTYSSGFSHTSLDHKESSGRNGVYHERSRIDEQSLPRPMQHIDDLKAMAMNRINPHAPIHTLLQIAEQSARQAEVLECRRPDLAYIEYLAASEIVINAVPRNKDFPMLEANGGRWSNLNKELRTRLNIQHDRFLKVKDVIITNNRRSGVQPYSGQILLGSRDSRSSDRSPLRQDIAGNLEERPLSMPDSSNFIQNGISPNKSLNEYFPSLLRPGVHKEVRARPLIQAKPEALRSRPFSSQSAYKSNYNAGDSLDERFARLRLASSSSSSNTDVATNHDSAETRLSGGNGPVRMPSVTDCTSSTINFKHNSQLNGDTDNAYDRRGSAHHVLTNNMSSHNASSPNPPPNPPPKVPLNTSSISGLPKLPSPTYSPARNMQNPFGVQPSRNAIRSNTIDSATHTSLASSNMSSQQSNNSTHTNIHPKSLTNGYAPLKIRRKSVNASFESSITAEVLYDYLHRHRVLLIDVRNRTEFDQGHIFSQSVMCIEPTALRKNMSAAELEESLVLSPDVELSMFDKRDEFDLVVYYDQSTTSTAFLKGIIKSPEESHLRILYDALYEFNQDKPLQRPPILLSGGHDAWADLVGSSALEVSDTASKVSSYKATKAARREQRIYIPSRASGSIIQRRRLRDYNPLDPEEERRWREKAQSEGVAAEPPLPVEEVEVEDNEESSTEISNNSSPHYRSYEDFFRRFPEPSVLDQESMIVPIRPSPVSPTYPPVSAAPPVPSRPPPAVARPSYSGVQDRQASTTVIQQSRSAHLPAYTPFHTLPQYFRLPRTGLINFGVTCYMNATLQCLSATLLLTSFFRDDRFRGYVQKENWKGSKGVMPELYANLIRSIWKSDVEAIRPTSLRNFCARLNHEWGIDQQQDAKEFLEFLLDCLHEDLNINWARSPLQVLTAKQEEVRESMPKTVVARREWERYQYRDKSFISDLFAGQHASRLRCTACHHTSTTFEAFYSVSIEIPRSGSCDIRDCLRSFCSEEHLSGNEVWKCPRCKTEREATKRIMFTRAPEYFVIHFKRFSASRGEKARKVRTLIDFPLTGFELDPFMLPAPSTPDEIQQIKSACGAEALTPEPSMTPPYRYDAYAVMRHVGTTLTSGHYIAMVKDGGRGCWKQYNDHKVTDFLPEKLSSKDRLQNEQAYIVFYQRVRR